MPERFHEVILFVDKGFKGDHRHVFRSLDLRGNTWNDVTSSFAVTSGAWQLYDHFDFQFAVGSLFGPQQRAYSWVEDYNVPNDIVSSIELAADDLRVIPHLILFTRPDFAGDHKHVFDDISTAGKWKNPGSFVVFSGRWLLRRSDGSSASLAPGLYPTANSALPGVSVASWASIQLEQPGVQNAVPLEHMMVFQDQGFQGNHRHVFKDLPRLDGGWDRSISSIAVERGAWQMCVGKQFTNPQGVVLTRGIYPWVDDIEIQNDEIRSIQSVAPPNAEVPLVSIANINHGDNALTAHGENYRLGWNPNETALTPNVIRLPSFGQLWATRMDQSLGLNTPDKRNARVYGQPLYVSAVRPRDGKEAPFDLVIVATANNDVVALDAADGTVVWQHHLGTPVNVRDWNKGLDLSGFQQWDRNTSPWHGVNSTPVIDFSGHTIYVAYLTKTGRGKATHSNDYNQAYHLQALAVVDGSPLWKSPVELKGTVMRADGSLLRFLPYVQTQRAALTYVELGKRQNYVLVPFSSRHDYLSTDPYYEDWQGWIFAVDVASNPPGAPIPFASAKDEKGLNGCGGIWGTAGLSVDDSGRVYAVTGNGPYDPAQEKFADSILRLNLGATGFTVESHYAPRNWSELRDNDWDLGGSSAVLLPPQPIGLLDKRAAAPVTLNITVTAGKDGRAYFVPTGSSPTGKLAFGRSIWRPQVYGGNSGPGDGGVAVTAAYFDAGPNGRFLYFASASEDIHRGLVGIKLDDLNGETMLGARIIQFEGERLHQAPGAPFVSSNGAAEGIVWAVESFRGGDDDGPLTSVLHAWDAVTGRLLYSSPQTAAERLGDGRKFVGLTVIKGRVLVPADGVACYGIRT